MFGGRSYCWTPVSLVVQGRQHILLPAFLEFNFRILYMYSSPFWKVSTSLDLFIEKYLKWIFIHIMGHIIQIYSSRFWNESGFIILVDGYDLFNL